VGCIGVDNIAVVKVDIGDVVDSPDQVAHHHFLRLPSSPKVAQHPELQKSLAFIYL
jgi:hypothetical protein